MMNIAIFCSGNGTNLQALIDARKKKKITGNIKLVVSDNKDSFALSRAKRAGIETLLVERNDFPTKLSFEKEIIKHLKKKKIQLIVLAGFMRMLSGDFVEKYKNRILNIHPALLPSFKGAHGIRDAFLYGVKVTGVTVHFVSKDMDEGPIILQEAVKIDNFDTEGTLTEKIHRIEHRAYPRAVQLFIDKRLKITGRKIKII